jgi:hypothetical protein
MCVFAATTTTTTTDSGRISEKILFANYNALREEGQGFFLRDLSSVYMRLLKVHWLPMLHWIGGGI